MARVRVSASRRSWSGRRDSNPRQPTWKAGTLNQLSYARSGCLLLASFERSKPVAVRADDIALGGLGQHPLDAAEDHPSDGSDLGGGISMIKIHRALRKSTTAVGTGHRSELIEEIGPMPPTDTLTIDPRRDSRRSRCEPFAVTRPTAEAMAVHTYDVALRCFGKDLRTVLERRAAGAECEPLLSRIAVIEVHLMRLKVPAAVKTRNIPKLAQKRGGRLLSAPHPIDFAFAVASVVLDVFRALVPPRRHGSI